MELVLVNGINHDGFMDVIKRMSEAYKRGERALVIGAEYLEVEVFNTETKEVITGAKAIAHLIEHYDTLP